MGLDLLKRAEKGAKLSSTEHDTNFTSIETTVNAGGYVTLSGTGATERSGAVRANDLVFVGDYGATGDGTTNDRTALDNCLTAKSHALAARGAYVVGSNWTLASGFSLLLLPGASLAKVYMYLDVAQLRLSEEAVADFVIGSRHAWAMF